MVFEMSNQSIGVGVIGYGYWGPNVVRNLASLEESRVLAIAEISAAARGRAGAAKLAA